MYNRGVYRLLDTHPYIFVKTADNICKTVDTEFCMKREKTQKLFAGLASGFLNGLFGSGGGVVAVMFLRNILKDEKKAHASATLMILIMSTVSLALYGIYGHIDWSAGIRFIPGGIIGAVLGTFLLKNIKAPNLKRLFGLVLAVSGVVLLLR